MLITDVVGVLFVNLKRTQMRTRKGRKTGKRRRNPNLRIRGLHITPQEIRKVNKDVEYSFAELDLLLTQHQEKISNPLISDLFFDPKTFDVIEYDGEKFAVKMN